MPGGREKGADGSAGAAAYVENEGVRGELREEPVDGGGLGGAACEGGFVGGADGIEEGFGVETGVGVRWLSLWLGWVGLGMVWCGSSEMSLD